MLASPTPALAHERLNQMNKYDVFIAAASSMLKSPGFIKKWQNHSSSQINKQKRFVLNVQKIVSCPTTLIIYSLYY